MKNYKLKSKHQFKIQKLDQDLFQEINIDKQIMINMIILIVMTLSLFNQLFKLFNQLLELSNQLLEEFKDKLLE